MAQGCGQPVPVTREKSVGTPPWRLTNRWGNSATTGRIESARVILESAGLDELNCVWLEAVAHLWQSVGRNM